MQINLQICRKKCNFAPEMSKFFVYRALTWGWHRLSSWNTGGEGIHSPSLFYIVRFLFPRQYRYYGWDEIENVRDQLLRTTDTLPITDYGTGTQTSLPIYKIAKNHLERSEVGQLFFKLIVHLRHELQRDLNIVELGTSLGLTTAYLATPHSGNKITTYEGNPETLRIAQRNWERLRLTNITPILGNIDHTLLYNAREEAIAEPIDFIFMDANHRQEPTLRYFQHLLEHLHEHSIVVIDDIYHSPEMTQAWKQICALPQVTSSIDCYHFGILFFDSHLLKRHYRIRL